ncbi:DUF4175 domain-containing protein [Hyphomonas sp.]|uniref:DUF4175 domain-containing protein n=1 Tax=Hyphomonas sp. TaxID=87 RepID=UPI0039195E29
MDQDEGLNALGAKLAATRRRLLFLAIGRAGWPVFVFVSGFLALALAGVFTPLSPFLRTAILLPLLLLGAGLALYGWRRFQLPQDAEVRQLLDQQSELRPISSLMDRPVASGPVPASLWQTHRARLLAELRNLRPPSLAAEWRALDKYHLRFVLPALVLVLALLAGPAAPGRLSQAFMPDVGALAGADRMVVEAWVTPPDYTGRAPIFLQAGTDSVRIPIGSEVTLRTQAASAPRYRLRGDEPLSGRFMKMPDGAYEAKVIVRGSGRLSVHWWGERAGWAFTVEPDEAPAIEFVSLPAPGARDQVEFRWQASDDYGVVGVALSIRLRDPHPSALDAEDRVSIPMPAAGGEREMAAAAQLDLTRHKWAGLAVELTLNAVDGAGQEGRSETVPFILPEKLMLDPLARAAQEARLTVLREPREYEPLPRNAAALTPEAINSEASGRLHLAPDGIRQAALMLDSITYRGDLFVPDLGAFMGLRMALGHLQSATTKAEADGVETLLWSIALKLEYGSVADARARLEAARAALERALRDGASEDEIRRLMQAFRDAANEYLAARMAEAFAQGLDAPSDQQDSAAQAANRSMGGSDFEDMLNALQDLTETGATEQARQLLSDITNLLQNLEFQRGQGQGDGMPGMPGQQADGEESDLPPEEQEMTDAMRRLSELLREQRQLNDDTLAQQRGEERRGQQGSSGEGGPPQDGEGTDTEPGQTGPDRSGTLAERQGRLGQMVEEFGRQQAERGRQGETGQGSQNFTEVLEAIREAQRRAERALNSGNEARALADQERATQMLSQLSRDLASQLDELRAARLGEQGESSNDPFGRPLMGAGNDGEGVEIPSEAERQRAREILNELRRRYGEASDEEERDYLRRLLERF